MLALNIMHDDHGLTPEHKAIAALWLQGTPEGFFISTVMMPEGMTLPCGLYGPIMGDRAVQPWDVKYKARGDRAWSDRLVDRPYRQDERMTMIGVREGDSVTLYTVYGGPAAPQNPFDPSCKDQWESAEFWTQHALSSQPVPTEG